MENGTFPDLDINTASIIESGGTPAKNCWTTLQDIELQIKIITDSTHKHLISYELFPLIGIL